MNEQVITEQIIRLGLTEAEAQIFLHLLKTGPKTPLEISQEANINRTKIYRLIDTLRDKKLIEQFGSERGLKLRAAPPVNLELLVIASEEEAKRNRESLSNIIHTLSSFPNDINEKFEVTHYKGVDGLKQMLWNELQAKEVLIFGYENVNEFVGKDFAEKIREEEVLRNIKMLEIGNSPEYKNKDQSFYTKTTGWGKIYEYRLIPEKILKIQHGIQIYDNTISYINWKNGKVGIEIKNKPLAEMQRQIFWHYWDISK